MKIAIDLDECTYDLLDIWIKKYREITGDTNEIIVKTWDFTDEMSLMDEEEAMGLLETDDIFLIGNPIIGALPGIKKLVAAGHDIYFLTSCRFKSAFNQKFNWIKQVVSPYVGEPLHDKLIGVSNMKTKGFLSSTFDVVIDDCPYLFPLLKSKEKILMAYLYNETTVGYTLRTNSWEELVEYLLGEKND